jgi:hypothetical protein
VEYELNRSTQCIIVVESPKSENQKGLIQVVKLHIRQIIRLYPKGKPAIMLNTLGSDV